MPKIQWLQTDHKPRTGSSRHKIRSTHFHVLRAQKPGAEARSLFRTRFVRGPCRPASSALAVGSTSHLPRFKLAIGT